MEIKLEVLIAVFQGIGVPIILYMANKVRKIYRKMELGDLKHQALVDTLSPEYGNGEFKKRYDRNLTRLKDDISFVEGK